MTDARPVQMAGLVAVAVAILLGLANLWFGELNQDEGWYLYAAQEVAHGSYPYKDYAFTQAPLLPFVYALATPLVSAFGLGGGRFFTILLGLGAAWLASLLSRRMAPDACKREAAWLTFVLTAINVYQSYFTTIVKTYALCGLFLAAGFLALSYVTDKRRIFAAVAAGLLLACAAGTRISSGAALAVGGFYLLFNRKTLGDGPWLAFGVAGAAGLAAIFLPWYFAAKDGFLFGVFEYHSLRSAGGLKPALVYKAGFVSRVVQAYYPAIAAGVAALALHLIRPGPEDRPSFHRFPLAVWVTVALITLVHFSAPFPYDDYQVPLYPLFCAGLSVGLLRWIAGLASRYPRALAGTVWAVLLLSVAASFASPINQSWMILGRDRIWWKVRAQPQLKQLRDVAAVLRENSKPGDELLTQDTFLAVEAGLRVPKGLEMGPFSFYADWPREEAEKIHVVNEEMMTEILRNTPAPLAAFSGYGLSIQSPEVIELDQLRQQALWSIVKERYETFFEVANFGQGATTLRVLERKDLVATERE